MEKIRGLASLELALSIYSILFHQEIFVFGDGEVWEGESKTDCIIFYKKFWRYWKHRKFTYICRHWLNYSEIRQNQSKPIPVSLPEQDSSEGIISASSWSLSLHFPREAPPFPWQAPQFPPFLSLGRPFSLCSWKGNWNTSSSRKTFLEKRSDSPFSGLLQNFDCTSSWHLFHCATS